MRLGILGGGSMGEAIIDAALKAGLVQPADVTVSDVAEARLEILASKYGVSVTGANEEAAQGVDVLLLAVKPQDFSTVAEGLLGKLDEAQTVVSIMAGVPAKRIADELGHAAVVRVMPNTPASVGQAMSVWLARGAVSDAGRAAVSKLLQALGREIEVHNEDYLDMVTALSGSGPGYIFLFLEALIDAGEQVGLPRGIAQELALQTLFGSATLARQSDKPPAELREMVTSKGGTTAAGLQVLEDAGLREAVVRAVAAAHKRAKELGA